LKWRFDLENGVQSAIFYILAAIIVCSAVLVVTLKNLFHSLLFLVLTFFSVAGIYVLLHAEFLAAVQVLIYVGAITVLLIFAIMMTAQIYSPVLRQSNQQVIPGIIVVGILLVITLIVLGNTTWRVSEKLPASQSVSLIGKSLLTTYVLPFEVVSVVLITALIGAIIIARRD
jgi:NADH:ubiquinone oxidoreductase subunit 6 (subunit J)